MISDTARRHAFARDEGECILCRAFGNAPCGFCEPNAEAHFVPRSLGGVGDDERNILTLCRWHHREFDQGSKRQYYREYLRRYLQSCYPDWNEERLYYRKDNY